MLTVPTRPFPDQRPGTSGLRKRIRTFQQAGYVENFVQSIMDTVGVRLLGATLVLGGDGRFYNAPVTQTVIRMAAANGIGRVVVGRDGLLSTPAASHLIRARGAAGGIILSASHNPGGQDGDFGIKFNGANGGPATEALTEAIFARTQVIDSYKTVATPDVPLDDIGCHRVGDMVLEVIDPVHDYADMLEGLFDFSAIRALIAGGFTLRFDAMHAVTGPYAREILEQRLGAAPGTVINATPLEDFGGGHPDPNPVWAGALVAEMMSPTAPDFGAASDGDGDRHLILGRGIIVSPSDALAVLAANAQLAPAYEGGIKGIARSMPTSAAPDQVAWAKGIPLYETPTGWKFFGNLLDAGLITLCGEESAGAGSDHIREKDGLWAILLWLNILAVRRMGVAALMSDHWARYGRNYYARHDYEAVSLEGASGLMAGLRTGLSALPGRACGGRSIVAADEFSYHDPVDRSRTEQQGIRITFDDNARIVFRLSGTGTAGATLRVYFDRYEPVGGDMDLAPAVALADLATTAELLADIARHTGRNAPDIVS